MVTVSTIPDTPVGTNDTPPPGWCPGNAGSPGVPGLGQGHPKGHPGWQLGPRPLSLLQGPGCEMEPSGRTQHFPSLCSGIGSALWVGKSSCPCTLYSPWGGRRMGQALGVTGPSSTCRVRPL